MSGATAGGIVVVIAVIVLVISIMAAARRRRLQQRFGPEYDRVVADKQSRRAAEAELASRERHVQQLDIRPLTPAARASYAEQWADLQEQFVDQPQRAVADAQALVAVVMKERGYPAEGHDQIAADLSVQHAAVLDRYRAAEEISRHAAAGNASTEDLRQAMIHYRALFGELLVQPDPAGRSG
jgi:Tfp pilus assembly protein PilX